VGEVGGIYQPRITDLCGGTVERIFRYAPLRRLLDFESLNAGAGLSYSPAV